MKQFIFASLFLIASFSSTFAQTPIKIGAKHFNEGMILGEMIALVLEDGGFSIERKFNLGGTTIAFQAFLSKDIDVIAEYSGTLSSEILKKKNLSLDSLALLLNEKYALEISKPYGFNNTYALAVHSEAVQKYKLRTLQDLAAHPELKAGMSHEFLKREDGWASLAAYYKLKQQPSGLEHGLAYQALANHSIDITDVYTTDGDLEKYKFTVLEDNLNFFPKYEALSLYQKSLPAKAKTLLSKLENTLTDEEMQKLNARVIYEKKTAQEVAYQFLSQKQLIQKKEIKSYSLFMDIFTHTLTHLKLALLSLFAAILVAIPLGIVLYRLPAISKPLLYIAGMLQTIPSIALLALMIPFLGIGVIPAVIALFLYALLPILRNTVSGLVGVDPQLKKVAIAMGLNTIQQLRFVEFPLATPMILTGIRTAAVINVGTATLAAFIGAGGLGEFIVTGLALNDTNLILMGAIPSAILAILIELCFEVLEWFLIPIHLRQKTLTKEA
ncbi:MAG: glycine betaine ABC transporter substrate-binding protein [Bacteroidia bacterium]